MRKKLLIAADVDRSLHERAAADGRFEIIAWTDPLRRAALAASVTARAA